MHDGALANLSQSAMKIERDKFKEVLTNILRGYKDVCDRCRDKYLIVNFTGTDSRRVLNRTARLGSSASLLQITVISSCQRHVWMHKLGRLAVHQFSVFTVSRLANATVYSAVLPGGVTLGVAPVRLSPAFDFLEIRKPWKLPIY